MLVSDDNDDAEDSDSDSANSIFKDERNHEITEIAAATAPSIEVSKSSRFESHQELWSLLGTWNGCIALL